VAPRLIDRVGDIARDDLVALGLRKRSGQVYTTELTEDAIGWLGLNSASEHRPIGIVEVNPIVGIRHQPVERMVAELLGSPFHAYQPPTVNRPLGYLLPANKYLSWNVDTNDPVSAEQVGQLVETLRDYGLPFMRDNSSLHAICTLLEERVGFEHQIAFRRPVAWLLAGDRVRARRALDETIGGLGSRDDPAAEQLRQFGRALEDRL
jgi:hypothetical protein